jgi:hypothetical protein
MSKFCNFLYFENSLLWRTIFSNKAINSTVNSAYMKAWTAVITSYGSLLSGRALVTTWSIIYFLCSLSLAKTRFQSSIDCLLTRYWACDNEIIDCTNKNSLYRIQAQYLVNRQSMELWKRVLANDNEHRK